MEQNTKGPILLVMDNAKFGSILIEYMKRDGYDVELCPLAEVVEKISLSPPRIIMWLYMSELIPENLPEYLLKIRQMFQNDNERPLNLLGIRLSWDHRFDYLIDAFEPMPVAITPLKNKIDSLLQKNRSDLNREKWRFFVKWRSFPLVKESGAKIKWDELVNYYARLQNQSGPELYQTLINVTKYAILTPLGLVTTAVEILKDDEQVPPAVQSWAQKCYQAGRDWMDNHTEIHHRCDSDDGERTCKCILRGLETLFANSPGLLVRGSEFQRLDLDEDQKTGLRILLEALSVITQIHNELQEQNLSWLLNYIDEREQAGWVL